MLSEQKVILKLVIIFNLNYFICFFRILQNDENKIRPRSNTVTCTKEVKNTSKTCDSHHLCAFDSLLHSKICSNINTSSKFDATKNNSPKNILDKKQTPLKLKTSVLNQLDQNLTPEQKFVRKLNDIEKWLIEHEVIMEDQEYKLKENKNIAKHNHGKNFSQLRGNLNSKKTIKENVSINNIYSPCNLRQNKERTLNGRQKHFSSSVNLDAKDCENLLNISEEEQPLLDSETASSSSVRFVHIHHHFYHYENGANFQ